MEKKVDLRDIAIFSRLPEDTLAEISAVVETRLLGEGQVLFNQGDPGEEMFVVVEGSVSVYIPSQEKPGEERPIRIFGPGDVFGEMALIDRAPRSLSARALESARVLVLAGDDFRQLLQQHTVTISVMAGLNDRIRYTTDFLGEVRGWVKRVAAGQYDRSFKPQSDYRDRSIAALAAEFAQMATQVKEREEALRREVMELRIEIDQAKKERQVGEIVESDYFQALRSQAKELRQQHDE